MEMESDRSYRETSQTGDGVSPSKLEKKLSSYGSEVIEIHGNVIEELMTDRIEWKVSQQLYRAGGYCTTQFAESVTHEIVISYPAFRYWGWGRVKEIVRHELAHAEIYEVHGPSVEPHGSEFRALAQAIDAPIRGEEPLPYRFVLDCSECGGFVDGLYTPSNRTNCPHHYRSDCCDAPLLVDERYPRYD